MVYLQMPVEGVLTDAFGWRDPVYNAAGQLVVGEQLHSGRDIAAPEGTPIYAAAPGTVSRIWWDAFASGAGAGGWMIELDHGSGISTRYAHKQARSWRSLGEYVTTESVVGHVGSTGAATGAHLHFEVLIGGQFVDPDLHLHPRATADAPPPPPPPPPWEDTMQHFAGQSKRTAPQKIRENTLTRVQINDAGDVTLAWPPGDVVSITADVRLAGEPESRVEVTLVRETVVADKVTRTQRIGQSRGIVDSAGLAGLQVSGACPLEAGQRLRVLVQTQAGAGVSTIERVEYRGYARPA
ncbi:M23 family metallopeptidase [Leucobacter allii]|uniref:M23 family metallopeptidase n=1 Tax=Leucobacter allii TaxID=2932247 RepID=A0ABY4FP93_9MICO|nr:M23 family metallopeptidase [Leucobacter allii]UOQ58087.1 M23 family metallopeptidase [Leucobacter allii]